MSQQKVFSSLINAIYCKAFQRDFSFPLPIRFVDSPEIAKQIFLNDDIFIKNYSFIEKMGRGRFSANKDEWIERKKITQLFYQNATQSIDHQFIYSTYKSYFKAFTAESSDELYHQLIKAALQITSRAFGLECAIPWPSEIVEKLRRYLTNLQAISWGLDGQQDVAQDNELGMMQARDEIRALWARDKDMSLFLRQIQDQGSHIQNFDASDEMMQNILAASETVASSIAWVIENLTRHSTLANLFANSAHENDFDLFISEVLRLYPPVPFVTRVCLEDFEMNQAQFFKNESILISIVGIHCHPDYWSEPSSFKVKREEFTNHNFLPAYLPFLTGPRVCAGMKLAKLEVKYGMRAFLDVFTLAPCHEPRQFKYGVSSRPGIALEKYLRPI